MAYCRHACVKSSTDSCAITLKWGEVGCAHTTPNEQVPHRLYHPLYHPLYPPLYPIASESSSSGRPALSSPNPAQTKADRTSAVGDESPRMQTVPPDPPPVIFAPKSPEAGPRARTSCGRGWGGVGLGRGVVGKVGLRRGGWKRGGYGVGCG